MEAVGNTLVNCSKKYGFTLSQKKNGTERHKHSEMYQEYSQHGNYLDTKA